MKKRHSVKKSSLLFFAIAICSINGYAQWNGSSVNSYTTGGNVGIGIGPVYDTRFRINSLSDPTGVTTGGFPTSASDLPAMIIQRNTYSCSTFGSPAPSNILELWQQLFSCSGASLTSNTLKFIIDPGGNVAINKSYAGASLDVGGKANIDNVLTLGSDLSIAGNVTSNLKITSGYVAIGPSSLPTPTGYKLYVAQGILTEKLKVASSTDPTNWADFVFNKDYQLMPLNKVESYINEKKHLPEIPSAEEVSKDGIDVAQIDAKLLQKIEELTLYTIEQQKQIAKMQSQINTLINAGGAQKVSKQIKK